MQNTWFDGGALTFDEYVMPFDTNTKKIISPWVGGTNVNN